MYLLKFFKNLMKKYFVNLWIIKYLLQQKNLFEVSQGMLNIILELHIRNFMKKIIIL